MIRFDQGCRKVLVDIKFDARQGFFLGRFRRMDNILEDCDNRACQLFKLLGAVGFSLPPEA